MWDDTTTALVGEATASTPRVECRFVPDKSGFHFFGERKNWGGTPMAEVRDLTELTALDSSK